MPALPAASPLTRSSTSARTCGSATGRGLERLLALAPRQRDDLVLAGELAVALGGLLLRLVALVASLLVTGATAEHAAQLEKDHDRQNEKQ